MRVPKRKPGKYTNVKIDPYLTMPKYEELKINLKKMKSKRPLLAEEVKFYAQNGDFSENAEYQNAKGRLRGLNERILKLENLLKKAIIIKAEGRNQIVIGSIVTLKNKDREKTYQILGSSESNPEMGIISHISPLGQALLNKKVDETITLNLKDKKITYQIIKIE